MNYIAANLKHIRALYNYTQKDLGEKLGLNRGRIASYENNTAEPNIDTLISLSKTFHVNIHDLLTRDLKNDLPYFMHPLWKREAEADRDSLDQASHYALMQQANKLINQIDLRRKLYDLRMQQRLDTPRDIRLLELDYEKLMELTDLLVRVQRAITRKDELELEE